VNAMPPAERARYVLFAGPNRRLDGTAFGAGA
jgi:hypothetical protein